MPSLILAGLMEISDVTSVKASFFLRGIGGEHGSFSLHSVFIKSIIIDYVVVGVMPSLSVEGASLLLGNDIQYLGVSLTKIHVKFLRHRYLRGSILEFSLAVW